MGNERPSVKNANCLQGFGITDEDLLNLWIQSTEKNRQELFTDTAGAAAMIGISQRAVRLWIDSGRIRAVPVGKKHRIWLRSLEEYLAKRIKTWQGIADEEMN
jgi:excisionase family DNA binding protein